MRTEFRIDAQRFGPRQLRRDARGFVVAQAAVTRTGILEYKHDDGTITRELRAPEEVFSAAHLESMSGASVTVGHPTHHVNPHNMRSLEVGVVTSARRDGTFVAAELSIRDAAAIDRVEREDLCELSCGYTLSIDPTPGVFEGQRFDARQTNLRVNHVALGPKGWARAGREVRIRMDSLSPVVLSAASTYYDERSGTMSSRQDAMQRRVDAATKKYTDANLPEGSPSLYDRQHMSTDERLAAAERRLADMGKAKR